MISDWKYNNKIEIVLPTLKVLLNPRRFITIDFSLVQSWQSPVTVEGFGSVHDFPADIKSNV